MIRKVLYPIFSDISGYVVTLVVSCDAEESGIRKVVSINE